MGVIQGARTLCRYDFEISTWYRILFVELAFHINGVFRVIILYNEPKQYRPPYWEYLMGAFIAILCLFFLKLWLLCSGLTHKNSRRLNFYAILNATIIPLLIPLIIYLRWNQWRNQTAVLDTVTEILVFIIFVTVGAWGIFFAVPRLVQRLDFTSLKRLERYVVLQPVEVAEDNIATPRKLEYYERYYKRRSTSTSTDKNTDKKENNNKEAAPEKFKDCFISPLHVSIDKEEVIGEGQFGLVYKSYLLRDGQRFVVVAKSAKHDDIHSIVHEVAISIYVGQHPNIVHFMGVTSDAYTGNYYLLSEYCEGGCLLSYLERLKPYKSTQYVNISAAGVKKIEKLLIRFTLEILQGMAYLASKRVIHGDLSARNIVLAYSDNNILKIKICDFGQSNRLYNYQLYSKQMQQDVLPWRWLSIEVLEDLKYSEKSDVYAFGVTMFELYGLGTLPHSSLSWSMDIIKMLRSGELKLEQPQLADDFTYSMMSLCWHVDSTQRPSFVELEEIYKTHYNENKTIIEIT